MSAVGVITLIVLCVVLVLAAIYSPHTPKLYPLMQTGQRFFKLLPPRTGTALAWVIAIGAIGWLVWRYVPWAQIGAFAPTLVFTPGWQIAYLIAGALLLFSIGATVIGKIPVKQVQPALLLILLVVLSHLAWSIAVFTFARPCEGNDPRAWCNAEGKTVSEPPYAAQGGLTVLPRKVNVQQYAKVASRWETSAPTSKIAVINCDGAFPDPGDEQIVLQPGEGVVVTHLFGGFNPLQEKETRCSFDYGGTSYPIYGTAKPLKNCGRDAGLAPNGKRKQRLKEYENDYVLPPSIPDYALGFTLSATKQEPGVKEFIAYDYIKCNGGKILLVNRSDKETVFQATPQVPGDVLQKYKAQIAYDGSHLRARVEKLSAEMISKFTEAGQIEMKPEPLPPPKEQPPPAAKERAAPFEGELRPTVSLEAIAPKTPGQPVILKWFSERATSCTASGAWSGPRPLSGMEEVRPSGVSTYTLSCTGPGGTEAVAKILIPNS